MINPVSMNVLAFDYVKALKVVHLLKKNWNENKIFGELLSKLFNLHT